MIYIINQHKGKLGELLNHLDSYKRSRLSSKFWMTLVVDQVISDIDRDLIDRVIEDMDGINIIYHDNNYGLSHARCTAIDNLPDDSTGYILFGCTNCSYTRDLTDKLHDILTAGPLSVRLIPCEYLNSVQEVDEDMLANPYVTISDYISNLYKPDFTLMIPRSCSQCVTAIGGEVYYPEELILLECLKQINSNKLDICEVKVQLAWYNPHGMSVNFNRKFVQQNSEGFRLRASKLLSAFEDNKLYLSNDVLKGLMYDYVTTNGDPKKFKSALLKSLYYWALQNWLSNVNYNHRLKFEEDVK